jgi:hypothetical protein
MTKPTDAQIEAFRKAMPIWWQRGAAQKKEEIEDVARALEAALTAAAEVGRNETEIIEAKWQGWFDEAIIKVKAKERERCAQVAEATITDDPSWANGRAKNIAAAIRALKDER